MRAPLPVVGFVASVALAPAPALAAQPSVDVVPVGLQNLDLGMGQASFDLVLRVTRTRGLPVRLRRLDYSLDVGQVEVTEASATYQGVRLRRDEPVEIAVPVSLNAGEAAAVALSAVATGELRIRLSGKAGVSVLLFPITVPFEAGLVELGTR